MMSYTITETTIELSSPSLDEYIEAECMALDRLFRESVKPMWVCHSVSRTSSTLDKDAQWRNEEFIKNNLKKDLIEDLLEHVTFEREDTVMDKIIYKAHIHVIKDMPRLTAEIEDAINCVRNAQNENV